MESNLVDLDKLSFSINNGILAEKDKESKRPATRQEIIMWNLIKKWRKEDE